MIARTWNGTVPKEKADAYYTYLKKSGLKDYRNTKGNTGLQVLRKDEDQQTHYLLITFWDSYESIRKFAGDGYEKARYYPEDEEFLLELETFVSHYDVLKRNDKIETMTAQLALVYDKDPWYGNSIRAVLESVNPSHAFESPGTGTHSIAEIAAHMIAWREFAVNRLEGNAGFQIEQEQSFDWKRFSADKEPAWKIMADQFKINQEHLLGLLQKQDDSILEKEVAGKPYTFHYLLTGIVQHDLYHLGQIVYIQKILSSNGEGTTFHEL